MYLVMFSNKDESVFANRNHLHFDISFQQLCLVDGHGQ